MHFLHFHVSGSNFCTDTNFILGGFFILVSFFFLIITFDDVCQKIYPELVCKKPWARFCMQMQPVSLDPS